VKVIYTDGVQAVDLAHRQACVPMTIYNKITIIRRALAEYVKRRMAEVAPTA